MSGSHLSRRQFQLATVAGVLGCCSPVSSAEKHKGFIDAHVHVWTPDIKSYPLDQAFDVGDMQPTSFTPEELFRHTKPSGVDRIVLIQMSFYNFDNRYMLDMMAKFPGVFGGVGIVDHQAADVAKQMKKLASAGVKGFRLHSRGGSAAQWPSDAGMKTVWKTAADENLAVCPLINPEELPHVDSLCKQFPKTKVVIDHFARVGISGQVEAEQLKTLCSLSRHQHTHVKTSAFYALGKKQPPYTDLEPMIKTVVDAYGADRLMWASDCPYQVQGDHTYEASIALIRDHCQFLSAEQKSAILRGTAEKLFF
ncbi:amidohydrolase family protein [Planctomycetes bacterium K23_9]|uniref:4-sulfomuconolactone hydrolase n=1 Tax=Stieleria marina TaxID=1930275 RepID=A0A517NVN7_9BACT|nr:4-sulfomuconolactone hydrolase [Planctomycetes bacterium K23_9]